MSISLICVSAGRRLFEDLLCLPTDSPEVDFHELREGFILKWLFMWVRTLRISCGLIFCENCGMWILSYTGCMNSNTLLNLKYSLQALAQPASVQVDLFPDFVQVADELALEFNHWCLVVLQAENKFSDHQRKLLVNLDSYLSKISNDHLKEKLWTRSALQEMEEWKQVRDFAKEILVELNWEIDLPPVNRNHYVHSKRN